jgi:hypothetical protein
MYIKHIDAYGNELGSYTSIKEASIRIGTNIDLLYTVIKHKLPLNDGSKLSRAQEPSSARRAKQERIRKMITEHIKIKTHPRFLAKKYEIMLPEVMRILSRRANEEKLNIAYSEWLTTGETVKAIAERHEVTLNTLSARINRTLRYKENA